MSEDNYSAHHRRFFIQNRNDIGENLLLTRGVRTAPFLSLSCGFLALPLLSETQELLT